MKEHNNMGRYSKTGRKIRSLLPMLMAAMLLPLTGCGKSEGSGQETAKEDDFVYVAEYQTFPRVGTAVFDDGGVLYYLAADGETQKLYSLKIGEGQPVEVPMALEENMFPAGLGNDTEGNLLLCLVRMKEKVTDTAPAEDSTVAETVGNETTEDTESAEGDVTAEAPEQEGGAAADNGIEQVMLQKLSADGSVLSEADVTGVLASVPEFYVQSLLMDKEGNYYVCTGQNIIVFEPSGSLIFGVSSESYISNMFITPDGRVVIGYYDNYSNSWKLDEVDKGQKLLKDIESSIAFGYGTYQGGKDTDLLYTQDSILYSCNFKDDKPVQILDWIDSDIDSNNLTDFIMLDDGRIAAFSVSYTEESATGELAVLTRRNRSEVPEKTVLTYGTFYLPYYTNQDIVAFNKQSDKYRVEVKTYGDDNTDYETKLSLLNAEIASGKGPDIIDLVYTSAFEEYASTGVLEDLTPWLEKDTEIKREDYLPNILAEYERDGKLYAIIPCFGLQTIVGKISDVGDGNSWSVKDIIKLADSIPENAELLQYETRESILNTLCTLNSGLFINMETGECDFTGENFKEILEFSGRFPKEVNYDANGPGEMELIRKGELILLECSVPSVQMYQMYEALFGEPVNFIGYPTTQGNGNMIMPNWTTAGMNTRSEHKDGVWEFIRFNLTKERQENLIYGSANSGFPISKSALDKLFERDMEKEYYEDTDGKQKEQSKATWMMDDFTMEVYAATEEQVARLKEMINSAKPGNSMDSEIFGIINEEAQAFFEGQKSVEDVIPLIQDRVQLYVNESR